MFAQIIAICIFVTMFLLIILDKFERHYITLGSGALVLVLVFGVCMRSMSAIWETLNLGAFFQSTFWYGASEESTAGINWSTILFIAGMMIMVEGMGNAGFFRWLCMRIAKAVKYKTIPIFITFMLMASFLSMFIDSITVILFLAAVTVELAQLLKFNPVPVRDFLCKFRWIRNNVWRSPKYYYRNLPGIFFCRLYYTYRTHCRRMLNIISDLLLCDFPQTACTEGNT